MWQYFGIGPDEDSTLNEEAVCFSGHNLAKEFSVSNNTDDQYVHEPNKDDNEEEA